MKNTFFKATALTLVAVMLLSFSACGIADVKDKVLDKLGLSSSSSEISSSSSEEIKPTDNTPILTINNDYTLSVSEYEFIEGELTYIISILQSMLTDLKNSDILKSIDLPIKLPDLDNEIFNPENTQKIITILKTASYHAKKQGINPTQAEVDEEIDALMKKLKLVPLALVLNRDLKKTAESYVNELNDHIATMRTSGQADYFNTFTHDIYSVIILADQLETSGNIIDVVNAIEDITKSYDVKFDETLLPTK